jgi:hypothetical protein
VLSNVKLTAEIDIGSSKTGHLSSIGPESSISNSNQDGTKTSVKLSAAVKKKEPRRGDLGGGGTVRAQE